MNLPLLRSLVASAIVVALAAAPGMVDGRVVNGNALKPVAGIEVHLTNRRMKPAVDLVQRTDGNGAYSFGDIPPGEGYSVAIFDRAGNMIGVGETFSLCDGCHHSVVPPIDLARVNSR